MSKSYFGLIDSRNSKYQGLINDDHFAGMGILIDQTATLALSNWAATNMFGPSLILYPSAQVFFGTLQANKPKGIVCFQLNRNEKCIINFTTSDPKNRNKSLKIAYLISGQSIVQMSANLQKSDYKILQVHYFNTLEDQIRILTKIFNLQVSKDNFDITSYINKNFIEASNLFQLSGGKNQHFFGFKDTISLGFKLENNAPTSVGFFKTFPRNIIFGRKVNYNIALPTKTSVQEGYFEPYVKTFTHLKQKASSIQFQKLAEDYFKKSTTFRNQFTTLDHLDQIYSQLKEISQKAKLQSAKKFGQTLLENDYGSSQQNPKDIVVKQYTLEEMKQQIYKAAAKKNKSNYNLSKSPIRQRIKKPLESLYLNELDSPSRNVQTIRKTKEPQLTRNQSMIRNRSKQNVSFDDQGRKKGFSYINSKKSEAIKSVDQIIKVQKSQQKALLQTLVDELKSNQKQSTRKEYNYSENIYQPIQRSRYQRYQPKITPFSQLNDRQTKSSLKQNLGRQVRYHHLQKAKQENALHKKRGLYEVIKRDKSTQRISSFELNGQEMNTKPHSNLQKYKQRRKQSTYENLMKKDKKEHYKYLQQEEYVGEGYEIVENNGKNIMPQIKLFGQRSGRDRQYSRYDNKGSTPGGGIRSSQQMGIELGKSTRLNVDRVKEQQRYGRHDKSPVFERSPTRQRQNYRDTGGLRQVHLQKNYS